jgi:hypothetical protein
MMSVSNDSLVNFYENRVRASRIWAMVESTYFDYYLSQNRSNCSVACCTRRILQPLVYNLNSFRFMHDCPWRSCLSTKHGLMQGSISENSVEGGLVREIKRKPQRRVLMVFKPEASVHCSGILTKPF